MQRTDWAERFVEAFSALPLVGEFVFRSPHRLDKGKEKEVCDLLLTLRGRAILVSLKCQQDPGARSRERAQAWAVKQAQAGARQAIGGVRALQSSPTWCLHPRRGRVAFGAGELTVEHALVVVELSDCGAKLPPDIPIEANGVPISYFTVDDLLNLVDQLRTFPDISEYLRERRKLPEGFMREVGTERVFFGIRLSNGNFDPVRPEVPRPHAGRPMKELLAEKAELDAPARAVESVANELAIRLPSYRDGLDAELLRGYDEASSRRNYLRLQQELADLPLPERRGLGQQLLTVVAPFEKDPKATGFAVALFAADHKPDMVYVVVGVGSLDRPSVIKLNHALAQAAAAHCGKRRVMVIADRGGTGFEVFYGELESASPEARAVGARLFGHLKVKHAAATLLPMGEVTETLGGWSSRSEA